MKRHLASSRGISLIELTILLVVVGILTAVAMKNMTTTLEDARRVKTEREMETLAKAIVGDPSLISSSRRASFGYVGDVGAFPPNLTALKTNPGYGTWNGPYIPAGFAEDSIGYRIDEWGNAYTYTGGLTISSSGHGTPIVKRIADAASDYLLNAYSGSVKDALDSLPGSVLRDSVVVAVTIPNGAGSVVTKTYHPEATGEFQLDSLPVGQHPLNIVYLPQHDTLVRSITILPRQRYSISETYKFASAYFSSGSGSGSNSMVLRPTGPGLLTLLTHSGCSANWQCVSEVTADDEASYVIRAGSLELGDYYALENPSSTPGSPIGVTVYCRARRTGNSGTVNPMVVIGGLIPYTGTQQNLTTSYADYSSVWSENPLTSSAWTWTQITNLQVGVVLAGQNATWPARCTQVWVEVRY